MSVNPPDQSEITVPVFKGSAEHPLAPISEKKVESSVQHIEIVPAQDIKLERGGTLVDPHNNVGLAVLEQKHVIPKSGKRMPTGKWEYICMSSNTFFSGLGC